MPHFEQNIMNGKREMIKELTNSALSILSKYENDERNGLINRDEAQRTALSRIQYLRYGEDNKDYFWITDMYPKMIIHPYRTDLNGKDLSNFKDPHGKKLFVEFVKTVEKSESGYVDYMWQWKDDSLHIVSKLSYVRIFKPWNWVIGTGIYIEDVKKEIKALTQKLLWISIGITFFIAFLLLFISQQSLKIEKKRIKAENELHNSKEKYRTLVEAATEGLLMLIDGKISFLNSIICKLTGYVNDELINHSLNELLSENNNKDIISVFSKNIVREGQYEVNLKKKNGGFVLVLATSSTALFYNNKVNIIIVKDISIDRNLNYSNLDYQKLITTLNLGFFRVKMDNKGKFLYANETTLRILGYDDYSELAEKSILEMISNAEERKNLRSILIENGYIKNKIIKIRKKNTDDIIAAITLVVYNNENSKDLVCDGIIEDITIQENEKIMTGNLISELKSNFFLIEQSLKAFISPIIAIDADSTIDEAIKFLARKKTDSLLVTKNKSDYIGIITDNDIQRRILALNLNTENPVYLIMSAPIISISESTSVYDALNICEEKNINHLVVKNEVEEITGILKLSEIHKILKNSLSFYIENVRKAETNDELKQAYKLLQLLIKPLIYSGINVEYITHITSSFSDAVIKRIIELCINQIGSPPVKFSFICLGSEGRKEETLLTDQDNAIIYDDIPPEKEGIVNEYFIHLGEKVCNSLNDIGYSFCMGKVMAKNQLWCQPISVWEKYFANWITTPEPQNLLDASIFFDFRNIYGEENFTNRLKNTITNLIKEHSLFLYHLAYNTYSSKSQQVSSGNLISDKHTDNIDLKNAASLIIMFARTYSFQNNIWCTNTIDRLNALKLKNIINANTIDEIIYAFNFLMKLRFKNQIMLLDNNLPLSNILNTKKLIDFELSILKKVLSLIPTYQNKISVDFRINT
jgi:PAS domain S-box-containing protein